MQYDVAIVGLGAMGSACAYAFAKRGARVIAFDRLSPPHMDGSTHGHTRIIREAYYEHPLYVPLVRRSYELWAELERETGQTLWMKTGGLWVGSEAGPLVRGALESARTHNIAHDLLDAAALNRRFPAYHARPDWVGLFEHRAGMLFPEKCVTAFLTGAAKRGASLRANEGVVKWSTSAQGVTVSTQSGSYDAKQLVVAAGAWLPGLTEHLGVRLPLEIERQMSHWFTPRSADAKYGAPQTPVALFEMPEGDMFLTMADEGHGVKCGKHHSGLPTSPDAVDRSVSDTENAQARAILDEVMPGAGGALRDARVCLYTNTPDRHFIIDWAPGGRTLVVSPCSGHGFKFASAIGEIAAQLALDGHSPCHAFAEVGLRASEALPNCPRSHAANPDAPGRSFSGRERTRDERFTITARASARGGQGGVREAHGRGPGSQKERTSAQASAATPEDGKRAAPTTGVTVRALRARCGSGCRAGRHGGGATRGEGSEECQTEGESEGQGEAQGQG
jgi:sarcosine oxidase